MKKYLLIALLALPACADMGSFHDVPGKKNQHEFVRTEEEPKPTGAVLQIEESEQEKWPVPNTAFLLTTLLPGDSAMVADFDGKDVKFTVVAEYASASKKYCKKYTIGYLSDAVSDASDLGLACFNPHWKPVRTFE